MAARRPDLATEPVAPEPSRLPSAGRVGRRRPPVNGRALAGGFLVAATMVGVVAVVLSSGAPRTSAYVVAARDLPPGATLAPEDLTTEQLTLPASGVGGLAYRNPSALVGRALAAPLRAGDLVQAGDVVATGTASGLRPVVVAVAPGDAAVLAVGGPADVLVTSGDGGAAQTTVVAAGARVLGIGRPSGSLVASGESVQVTLGVATLSQVTAVVHAAHTGTVSVVVGATGDQPGALSGATP